VSYKKMINNDSWAYLAAPLAGWIAAQSIKFVLTLRKNGITWSDTIQSGGMPSSHTAFMVSLSTIIGIGQGFLSALFALSAGVTAIVLYDALGVRRTTGEQTDAIKKIASKAKITVDLADNARGHTPIEVMGGIIVGLVTGIALSVFL
jgi:uncharacterized protein